MGKALKCVHETIADHVTEMVQGAAKELVTGDPAQLSTDAGPVIDQEALEGIHQHLQRLNAEVTPCWNPPYKYARAYGVQALPSAHGTPAFGVVGQPAGGQCMALGFGRRVASWSGWKSRRR